MKNHKLTLFLLFSYFLCFPSCKRDEKVMQVSTGTVTNILTTTADISGDILDLGEGATQYGHCYATTPNPNLTGTKSTYNSPTLGGFTSALEGLSPATKYYIKAYLSRGKDVVYGSEINFTTASDTKPVLTTAAVTDIFKTTAVSGGNITSQGGTPVTARGVCWSLATAPTVELTTKSTDGSGLGTYTSSITGLVAGTKYYVRAYATNAGGTSYGDEVSFTTTSDTPVPPTVTTSAVTSVTSSTAVCGGNVTSEGSASVTARGVCWSTSATPTIINSTTTNGSGSGNFVSNLTGLDPGTKYYIRAYATNSAGTGYGTIENFTTNAVLPTLTTLPVTSIAATTANCGGDITSLGGSNITVKGVCWGLTSSPNINDNKTEDGPSTVTGTFVSTIPGLTSNTQYYLRSYATNNAGTSYGNELSFATLALVTTAAITNITSASASGGGSITIGGGANIAARGVCWSKNPNPTIADSKTTDGNGTGSYISSLTGLASNTTYYVRAYATNSSGTSSYGDQLIFTTLVSITTNDISNITGSSAITGGFIAEGEGDVITARGVCWSTNLNPTISTNKTLDGSGSGSFISSLSSLLPNTLYYVRAYATCSTGTIYGNELNFTTTSCTLPSANTDLVSNLGPTTVTLNGNVNANLYSTSVIFEYGTTTSYGGTITASPGTVTGSSIALVSVEISGLSSNTLYHFRLKAINCGGTSYGNDQTFTTLCPNNLSVTHTAGNVAPVSKTLIYGIVQTNLSGTNKCWITQNLGADNQASSATDATEMAAGWYWQFNRKQGFKHDGTTRTPAITWITSIDESSNWTVANDPCTILLGTGWRIPTSSEWENADNSGGWSNYNQTYGSVLKLHAAGYLLSGNGNLSSPGSSGHYWSSVEYLYTPGVYYGVCLRIGDTFSLVYYPLKEYGFSIRCLRD